MYLVGKRERETERERGRGKKKLDVESHVQQLRYTDTGF